MRRIYLDYAATSPVKPEIVAAMRPYFSQKFGNPSSIHSFGQEARAAIDKARKQVAKFLHCQPEEIIFTSGGTESDNLALRGIIVSTKHEIRSTKQTQISNDQNSKRLENLNLENSKIVSNFDIRISNFTPHIITSAFEHHAVLHTCQDLEKQGLAEITYIKPDKEGIIHVEDIKKAIKPNTILVSIMYVNNEIGTVQPVAKISKLSSRFGEAGKTQNSKLIIHTDAVQAIEYFDCDVKKLGVDMLSLSAHKFGGPKGIGALYVRKGTPISEIQTGGAQEFNHRAGTENVAAIIGMAKAIRLLSNKRQVTSNKVKKLRDYFIDQIMKQIPDVILNGSRKFRSPNNINVSFLGAEGESILLNLDLLGIAASSGSACTSGSLEPSHVLTAIGRRPEDTHGSIRFTIGEKTSKAEIDYVVKNLVVIIKKLRAMNPLYKEQR